jgi:hypothetical protein
MSTKNLILGACATCLAVGSAIASHFVNTDIQVFIGGVRKTATVVGSLPSCSTGPACTIKVTTKNGVVLTQDGTIATFNGSSWVAKGGAGLLSVTAKTSI